MKAFDKTYREMEGICSLLTGKSIDHSTVGWALKRIPRMYIEEILMLLHERIKAIRREGVYISDSTGVRTNFV